MEEKKKDLIFTSLGHFTNDSTSFFYPVLITYYEVFPGANISLLGSMVIIFNLISGFMSSPVAAFADRKGNHSAMMSLGIAILGVSVVLYGLPFIFKDLLTPLILIATVFLGIGQAFYHPLGATIISRSFGKSAPPAMGLNGSMGSLGRALIPSIIVLLLAIFGDFNGMIVYAVYIFIAAMLIFSGLIGFRDRPGGNGRANSQKKQSTDVPEGSTTKYMTILYILTIAVFIRSLFLMGTTTYIPTYLTEEFHSRTVMSYIVTLGLVSPVFGQPFFGAMTSRRGGRYAVIITFVISTIFFGLFILITGNEILTTIFYAAYAFGAYSGFPVFLGYVSQLVPPSILGKSNGLVWGIGQTVGGAAGAAVITAFTLFTSVSRSIDLMFIFAIASLIFLPMLPSRNKIKKMGEATP